MQSIATVEGKQRFLRQPSSLDGTFYQWMAGQLTRQGYVWDESWIGAALALFSMLERAPRPSKKVAHQANTSNHRTYMDTHQLMLCIPTE